MTLWAICGFTIEEIAHAFLVTPTAMAQSLSAATSTIRDVGVPSRIRSAGDLSEQVAAVMRVTYQVFNEGYAATRGERLLNADLCREGIRLGRLLCALLPEPVAEAEALLALMLLQDSRRAARVNDAGDLVLLADQDRTRWDRAQIDEGLALLRTALGRGPARRYALEAAIAAVNAEAKAGETDWSRMAGLYERLYALHPSPVVALNGAVAVSMVEGPQAALPLVDALEEPLADYHLWHAARADLLRRLGRREEAIACYRRAQTLTENEVEQRFLERRLVELTHSIAVH